MHLWTRFPAMVKSRELKGVRQLYEEQGTEFTCTTRVQARIAKDQPFTCVYFAGPLYVTENGDMHKRYISVNTCAVSRAVHLDTVRDLLAEAFMIRNFRRFAARRGLHQEVISDNGKTAASKKLTALFKAPEMRKMSNQQWLQWSFNLERAP